MKLIKINNEMNLMHIKTDKFNTLTVSLVLRTKLSRETATKNALIPLILGRGTAKYKDIQSIQAKQEQLYGAIFDTNVIKKGEEQLVQIFTECLKTPDCVVETLSFLREAAVNVLTKGDGFLPKYFNSEKENLKNQILSRQNDRMEYSKLRCIEEMCREESFGIYGDGYSEDISSIENTELLTHYKRLLRENPIEFVVVGNIETEKIAEEINRLFSGVERENAKSFEKPRLETIRRDAPQNVTEEADVLQGKLCVGIRSSAERTGDEFYNFLLANEIFGGIPESLLFSNIREKESLCYHIRSFAYRFKSIILVQAGINAADRDRTAEMIVNQLEVVKNGEFSESVFENSKIGLIKRFESVSDYQSHLMDFCLTQHMLEDSDSIAEIVNRISKATKDGVVNAVKDACIDTYYSLLPRSEVI